MRNGREPARRGWSASFLDLTGSTAPVVAGEDVLVMDKPASFDELLERYREAVDEEAAAAAKKREMLLAMEGLATLERIGQRLGVTRQAIAYLLKKAKERGSA